MSEAAVHEQHHQPAHLERTPYMPPSRRFADEDRAWSQLYAAVLQGQPSTAEEVIKALDADPKAKQLRLALYTHAKTSLRKQKASEARQQRIASFLRMVLAFVVLGPIRLLRSVLSNGADVAVEMLPPARREPATARVNALKRDPDFAKAQTRVGSGSDGAQSSAPAAEESRGAKAA
jgi:hypothetical protein